MKNIPKTLIGFLIASLLIWFLINLSKEYSSVVSYKVNYGELAQDKLLQEEPIENIDLLLKGTGFRLLSAKLSRKKIFLKTDKLRKKNVPNFYLSPNNNLLEIQKQLSSGLKLEEVLQDTIHLKIGKLSTKNVPVVASVDLQFLPGYGLSEDLKIKPETISVSGTEDQLNKIKSISVNTFKLDEVKENFSKVVGLNIPESLENIRFNVREVVLIGKVDKFTEGTFKLPFKVENVPLGVDLNTFPKKVKVTYKVGLKNFGKIAPNSFQITCDYDHTKANNLTYLLPKVKAKPNLVSSVKVEPEKIEFLIHK